MRASDSQDGRSHKEKLFRMLLRPDSPTSNASKDKEDDVPTNSVPHVAEEPDIQLGSDATGSSLKSWLRERSRPRKPIP